MIKDFYDNWSVKKTCDTVILESRHPLKDDNMNVLSGMFYTYECKDDEFAYFKVDVNLIDTSLNHLGNVLKAMSKSLDYKKRYFQQYKVMLGMVGNNVECVKFIGRRDMTNDTNMRAFFDEIDRKTLPNNITIGVLKPYFNDAKELFRILLCVYLRGDK